MLKKPPLFYTHNFKAYFTFWRKYSQWLNKYKEDKPWHMWEERAVFVGYDSFCYFGCGDSYYDGHTVWNITAFGITIGWLYSYESEEMVLATRLSEERG